MQRPGLPNQGLLDGLTQEILCLCRKDPSLPFTLHTDWSTKGLGAILTQADEQGGQRMVACISRSLHVHEARYPAWKGELQWCGRYVTSSHTWLVVISLW
jgi:hypothetical protein